ncbi:hypothetical protein [Cytobacillus horneckiae]|uniref:hypothetical protein n=1 Tax=Cytobacillus horneckiae TaxID=549687 RepID=UPI003D9A362E
MDDALKELDSIHRKITAKNKSFQQIESKLAHNNQQKIISKRIPYYMTSIAAFLIFSCLVLWKWDDGIGRADNYPVLSSTIMEVIIATNHSYDSFQPIEYMYKKDYAISSNNEWLELLHSLITNAERVEEQPVGENMYDCLLLLENNENIKLKIWIEDNDLYFMEWNKKIVFKANNAESQQIMAGIQRIIEKE